MSGCGNAGPLQNHPAVDIATPVAVVVVQEREVVALEPLLLDALVSAGRAGVRLQLLTPPGSRLTAPLARALRANGGQWVVRRLDGSCFAGLSGQVLGWDGSCYTDPPRGPVADPAWADPPTADRGSLAVELTTLHPATRALRLGESVETCCSGLTDAGPVGWGVAEPVTQRWDQESLSTLCRGRAPGRSQLIVVGGSAQRPALGTLTVTPTTTGVREELWLQVGGGAQVDPDRLDRLAERLAAQTRPPRTALLGLQPGRDDGTVEPHTLVSTVPYGLFLGPGVVQDVGRDAARTTPVSAARLLGPPGAPALWVPLSGTRDPGVLLTRVLAHLGVTVRPT